MYRLSIIIGEIYNKFLPRAEKGNVSLNLDFSDTTQEISNPEEIRTAVEQALDSAFQRTDRGNISISVTPTEIIIADSGTILSKNICTLLSHGRIQVKSRVGFGTSVHVTLGPVATSAGTEPAANGRDHSTEPSPTPSVNLIAKIDFTEPAAAEPTSAEPNNTPTLVSAKPSASAKSSASTPAKAPTSRKSLAAAPSKHLKTTTKKSLVSKPASKHSIDAAAKRADKKLQKITQKAQKRLQKANAKAKTNKGETSTKAKPGKNPAKTKLTAKPKRKVVRKFDIS